MIETVKRVLVLAPHIDDGEFGCGGTIAKFIEAGKEVYYAAFSTASKSVPEGFPQNVLEFEVKKATEILGISPSNLLIYKYEVRKLNYSRQDILEEMIKLKKDIDPELICLPSVNDLHQDHHTIVMEGIRAFKQRSIISYELPWNNITFHTQAFVKLDEKHIKKKIQALKAYKSQRGRYYASEEFIRSLAITRGTQINEKYSEAFEVVRWII